ncbi:reverse transcriptase domain-containing protein [Tanacetum coccineum]
MGIRQFIGLASYYRWFIEKFSKIVKPLMVLTQDKKEFIWGDEHEEAFGTLKHKLCNAPILALLEGTENFVVYCDASHKGLGCKEALKEENLEAEKLYNADHKLEVWSDGVRYLKARAWIPKVNNLRDVILDEARLSRYLIHPGADKMYQDVKEYYGWPGMKKDIVVYVGKCLSCAKVKAEYEKPPICCNNQKF